MSVSAIATPRSVGNSSTHTPRQSSTGYSTPRTMPTMAAAVRPASRTTSPRVSSGGSRGGLRIVNLRELNDSSNSGSKRSTATTKAASRTSTPTSTRTRSPRAPTSPTTPRSPSYHSNYGTATSSPSAASRSSPARRNPIAEAARDPVLTPVVSINNITAANGAQAHATFWAGGTFVRAHARTPSPTARSKSSAKFSAVAAAAGRGGEDKSIYSGVQDELPISLRNSSPRREKFGGAMCNDDNNSPSGMHSPYTTPPTIPRLRLQELVSSPIFAPGRQTGSTLFSSLRPPKLDDTTSNVNEEGKSSARSNPPRNSPLSRATTPPPPPVEEVVQTEIAHGLHTISGFAFDNASIASYVRSPSPRPPVSASPYPQQPVSGSPFSPLVVGSPTSGGSGGIHAQINVLKTIQSPRHTQNTSNETQKPPTPRQWHYVPASVNNTNVNAASAAAHSQPANVINYQSHQASQSSPSQQSYSPNPITQAQAQSPPHNQQQPMYAQYNHSCHDNHDNAQYRQHHPRYNSPLQHQHSSKQSNQSSSSSGRAPSPVPPIAFSSPRSSSIFDFSSPPPPYVSPRSVSPTSEGLLSAPSFGSLPGSLLNLLGNNSSNKNEAKINKIPQTPPPGKHPRSPISNALRNLMEVCNSNPGGATTSAGVPRHMTAKALPSTTHLAPTQKPVSDLLFFPLSSSSSSSFLSSSSSSFLNQPINQSINHHTSSTFGSTGGGGSNYNSNHISNSSLNSSLLSSFPLSGSFCEFSSRPSQSCASSVQHHI